MIIANRIRDRPHRGPVSLARSCTTKPTGLSNAYFNKLNLRKYNVQVSHLIIDLLVCCFSKNLFQFSSSNFSEGYILRGVEMTRHKLALCLKDGPSWGKALAVTFRHFKGETVSTCVCGCFFSERHGSCCASVAVLREVTGSVSVLSRTDTFYCVTVLWLAMLLTIYLR